MRNIHLCPPLIILTQGLYKIFILNGKLWRLTFRAPLFCKGSLILYDFGSKQWQKDDKNQIFTSLLFCDRDIDSKWLRSHIYKALCIVQVPFVKSALFCTIFGLCNYKISTVRIK